MNTKYLFHVTLIISIIVQILTGIIEIGAFFVKVPTIYTLIKQLLTLELVVQFFEGVFYFWLALNFTKEANVTPKRIYRLGYYNTHNVDNINDIFNLFN